MADVGKVNHKYLNILNNLAIGVRRNTNILIQANLAMYKAMRKLGNLSDVDQEETERQFDHQCKQEVLGKVNEIASAVPNHGERYYEKRYHEECLRSQINEMFKTVLTHIEKRIKDQYKSVNKQELGESVPNFVEAYLQPAGEKDKSLSQLCEKHAALTTALNDRTPNFEDWKRNLLNNEALKKCHSGLYALLNRLFSFLGISKRIQSETADKVASVFRATGQEDTLRTDYRAAAAA